MLESAAGGANVIDGFAVDRSLQAFQIAVN